MWAWERLSHIHQQLLLPRGPLHDVHLDTGPADGVALAPALVHGPAPDVLAPEDLLVGSRGCR
ncbi:unnamed protein product [Ilex paraguariensis]|uniref:Uncharacterized protein n=1 Tax=Ilex paraguariensis TaxID=185542 RepID=A0ABC8TA15_9AQUA